MSLSNRQVEKTSGPQVASLFLLPALSSKIVNLFVFCHFGNTLALKKYRNRLTFNESRSFLGSRFTKTEVYKAFFSSICGHLFLIMRHLRVFEFETPVLAKTLFWIYLSGGTQNPVMGPWALKIILSSRQVRDLHLRVPPSWPLGSCLQFWFAKSIESLLL